METKIIRFEKYMLTRIQQESKKSNKTGEIVLREALREFKEIFEE